MDSQLVYEQSGQRTFVVALTTGEEVMDCLSKFVSRERISAAQISAIGALSDVELKYFDWDKKTYDSIPVNEQVEVASLLGDIAVAPDGKPALHIHLVVGRRGGAALAGHLGKAHVRPTLEVVLTEFSSPPAEGLRSGKRPRADHDRARRSPTYQGSVQWKACHYRSHGMTSGCVWH